jgi:hypothetical protein
MEESTIFGISVRALLALFTVGAGFLFLAGVVFGIGGESVDTISVAIIGFINLALGFYLGQKGVVSGSN